MSEPKPADTYDIHSLREAVLSTVATGAALVFLIGLEYSLYVYTPFGDTVLISLVFILPQLAAGLLLFVSVLSVIDYGYTHRLARTAIGVCLVLSAAFVGMHAGDIASDVAEIDRPDDLREQQAQYNEQAENAADPETEQEYYDRAASAGSTAQMWELVLGLYRTAIVVVVSLVALALGAVGLWGIATGPQRDESILHTEVPA